MNQRALLVFTVSTLALFCSWPSRGEDWPQFRGPSGQGISRETGVPLHWSDTSNVVWKTAIPGDAWSSPIVEGGRVFVTTATEQGVSCRVLCLDAPSGKIRWNKEVFQQVPKRKEGKNSYATPTPVADGERVYAVFGDGSIAAVDYDGNLVWTNRNYPFHSKHGLGASPVLYENLLIMPFDGSSEGEDLRVGWKIPWEKAVIVALDKRSGKVQWEARRGLSRIAHVTPLIWRGEGAPQLVSAAGDAVQGFDLKSGERLWSVYSQGEGVVPSLVQGGGLVYSSSGFEKPTIRAIRPGGRGDVTQTHMVWEQTRGVPTQPSFIFWDGLLLAMTDGGIANCFRAATGEPLWQERIGGSHSASPVYAAGRIYFLSEQGESAVIEAGPEFRLLARNSIKEKCQASMAVSGGKFFIRSEKNLFCIGDDGRKTPAQQP